MIYHFQYWVLLFLKILEIGLLVCQTLLSEGRLLLVYKVLKDEKVLEEVFLVSVDCEHFKDADHLVVPLRDHVVEERSVIVPDQSREGILSEDLMLELHDACDLFLVSVCTALVIKMLTPNCPSYLIWVIINLKILIFYLVIVILRGNLPMIQSRCRSVLVHCWFGLFVVLDVSRG